MTQFNILVVEDEPAIVKMLEPTLVAGGAKVTIAWRAAHALSDLEKGEFDLVLCDLGLPDMDGKQLVSKIRAASDVPIIVLSARESEQDKVEALDAGADDYVAKPFSAGELLARVRAAVRRRTSQPTSKTIKIGQLEVDLELRRVLLFGEEIRLSAREHSLLCLLARSPSGIATHKQIIEEVWGPNTAAETQSVRVLVNQLRHKLEEDASEPRILCTEPGVGYRLKGE